LDGTGLGTIINDDGAVADLSISKDDGVTSTVPGGNVTYTIVASNAGPGAAPGSLVSDSFPADLTCSWTCSGTGGGTCTPGPVNGNINDTVDLPVGASVTYTASCAVSGAATGSISNTATVAPGAGVTDPDPSNNSATDVDAIAQGLSISDVSGAEGNSGTAPFDFVVTLAAPVGAPVTVDFTTVDGTATAANNDYLPLSGTLVFGPGETSHLISVSVVGDLKFESDEDFTVVLSNPTNAFLVDDTGLGTILNDDTPTSSSKDELVHGSRETRSVGLLPAKANPTYFRMLQKAQASYEVVVDATTGDLGPNGPDLDRLASDGVSVVQSSVPASAGASRSLRWETDPSGGDVADEFIRVQSAGCNTNCDPADTYRIRAYESTYRISRFNNSATQVTVLIVGNATDQVVTGTLWYYQASTGNLLASQAVTLQPKATFVVNTATDPALQGMAGSIRFSNNAPFAALTGKAVAVEPATGFTFDTPMVPRPASTHMVPRDN
jgi:uncharacterized repeat protein (TIGR01451 family)